MLDDGALMPPALCRPQEGQIVPRLPRLPTLALYTLAHAGKTLFWVVSDLYFVWMVTVVDGVSGARAGLGIGLSILLAAGADYLGGRWLGGSMTTAAGHARLQLYACCATALALLVFAGAGLHHGPHLAEAMMAALILFRLTYAGLDITQNAVPALIAETAAQQADYAMWRNIAGGGIRILLSAGFVPLLAGHAPHEQAWRFLVLALAIGVIACLAALALTRRLADGLADRATLPLPDNADTGPDAPGLLIAMGLASLGMTLFQQLEPFLAAHLLAQASAAWAGALFITGGSAGGLICQPFWRALMLEYGARRLQQGVMVACLIAAALMVAPAWGQAWLIVWAILAGSLYGAAAGGLLLALWSRINASQPRDALARISRFSAGAKLGQALGLALAGWQIQNQPLALAAAMALALLPMMGAMALTLTAAAPHRQPV